MPDISPQYGSLTKFNEATEHFRQKIQLPTESWRDLQGAIHAKAFTVVGATETELLNDLYKAVDAAISDGETLSQFRSRFDDIVKKHGWSYNGKRGWRSQVIYQVNKNTARAAGRWQQQQRTKARRPYLLYLTAGDSRVRPEHQRWNYILLPVDHPFWDTHYPPNGWLCRCKVVSLNERDIKRMGLKVTDPAELKGHLEPIKTVDEETGEELSKLPGIDMGWDYNPGKAWLGPDAAAGKAIIDMPAVARQAAITELNKAVAQTSKLFADWVTELAAKKVIGQGIDKTAAMSLGHLPAGAIKRIQSSRMQLNTSTVTINGAALDNILTATNSPELLDELLPTLHQATDQPGGIFYLKDSLVKIVGQHMIVTIELGEPFNQVVAIQER